MAAIVEALELDELVLLDQGRKFSLRDEVVINAVLLPRARLPRRVRDLEAELVRVLLQQLGYERRLADAGGPYDDDRPQWLADDRARKGGILLMAVPRVFSHHPLLLVFEV